MLRISTNARKNASLLYHFTTSWRKLNNIVDTGRITPSIPERTRESGKRVKRTDDRASFVSTTRTPSTIYNASSSWRYGVILDAAKLSDKEFFRPYDYNLSEHELGIYVENRGPYWTYFIDSDMSNKEHKMTESMMDDFLDLFYDTEDDYRYQHEEDVGHYHLSFTIGEEPGEIPLKKIPPVLFNMMKVSGFESEDRIYSDEPVSIKNALVGVLVPDSEYFSEDAEEFRQSHPNFPMYIYRDPSLSAKTAEYAEVKERLIDEGLQKLYKLPLS